MHARSQPGTISPRRTERRFYVRGTVKLVSAAHQLDSARHLAVAVSQVLAANMLAGPMRAAT